MSITDELRDYIFYDVDSEKLADTLTNLADEIDEQYDKLYDNAKLPRDMWDEPCFLDDAVYYGGDKYIVVAISHKGNINIREFDKRNSGKGAIWVKASEVSHELDTQEKIYQDMEDLSVKYAHMQLHDAYCIEIEIKKLLKRQKELDKKKYAVQ